METFTYAVADSDGDTARGTVTVSTTGVNDAPTDIGLTSTTVAQSGGTDAVVGSLSATDVDDSNHTFSLVSGDGDGDNAEFNIDSDGPRSDDPSALAKGDYDVRIEAADDSGGSYQRSVTVSVTDDLAPTIASTTPADDATGVGRSDDITITFSEPIVFGSGTITLRESNGDFSDWATFDVNSDTGGNETVSVSGRTLTIDPASEFSSDTEYAVQIDAGALTDTGASPNGVGGITDDTTLNFTTTDSVSPTASFGPDTAVDGDTWVSFDASGSTDNVAIASYEWDWTGDGTYEGTGQTASHSYADPGTYTVVLRVTDGGGNTDTTQQTVTVQAINESEQNNGTDTVNGEEAPDSAGDGGGRVDSGDGATATEAPATTTTPPVTNTETAGVTENASQGTATGGSGPLPPVLVVVAAVLALLVHRQRERV